MGCTVDIKKDLFKMDAVDVYKMILKGDVIKKFPDGFWQQPEALQNAAKCIRYLIEEILKYDEDKIKANTCTSLFYKNKLSGMLNICFNGSAFDAINYAFSGKFYPWEFKNVPTGYWDDVNNGISATRWLISQKLKLSDDELRKKLSAKLFRDNGLAGMLKHCFNNSPFEAIDSAFPGKFYCWEFNCVSQGYWDDINNGIAVTHWLISQKLKLSDDELKEKLSKKLFTDNGLQGMLFHCFNDSPFKAINSAFPGKFHPWEFKAVPRGYWDDINNGISATRWLISHKLKLSDDELREKLSVKLFRDNGLGGMLFHCFNNSPFGAINSAFPNKFNKSEFRSYKRIELVK